MIKRVRLLAAIVTTALFPSMAVAEDRSLSFHAGNDLYTACTSENATYRLACVAYIDGASDAFFGSTIVVRQNASVTHTKIVENAPPIVCLPDGLTRGQVGDVVIKYLRGHPADRHDPASLLVWRALHEAWPCNP